LGNCIQGAFSSDTTISTPVAINKGGTGQTTAQAAIDALTAVSGASTNQVLTKDGSGNAVFAAAGGGQIELLDSVSLGSAAANLTLSSIDSSVSNYTYWILKVGMGTVDGGESLQFRINNSSASDYIANITKNTAGTIAGTTSGAASSAIIFTSNIAQDANDTFQFIMTIEQSVQNATNTYRFIWSTTPAFNQADLTPNDSEVSCGIFNQNSQTQLTKLDFFLSGGSNFTAGSNMQLYGVKRA
jgi:hypothetical protein